MRIMKGRGRRGGGHSHVHVRLSARACGICAALQRHIRRRDRCRGRQARANAASALLHLGACPAPAPANRSRRSRRSRGSRGARRRLRARIRRSQTRRTRHSACCSRAWSLAGASKVARKVYCEARELAACRAEADAISASLRRDGEHGSQLAPRVAAAQHRCARSGSGHSRLLHAKVAECGCVGKGY